MLELFIPRCNWHGGFDVWNKLIRVKVVFTFNCNAVERSDWHRLPWGARLCFVTASLPKCERGDYLILWLSRIRLQISYLLMAFTRHGTQPREKATFFLSLHKLVGAEAEKNDSDYSHTVLKSTFFCGNCWVPLLSRCVCVLLSVFLRGHSVCVCVCVCVCLCVCVHAGDVVWLWGGAAVPLL